MRPSGGPEISQGAVLIVDASQRIVYFSRGAAQLFGYRAEEIVGHPLDALMEARLAEDHGRLVERFAQGDVDEWAMGGCRTVHGVRSDGTRIETTVSLHRTRIGGELYLTATLRSVPLRGAQGPVSAHPPIGLLFLDARGRCQSANLSAALLLGQPERLLLGRSIHDMFAASDRSLLERAVSWVRASGDVYHGEEREYQRADGSAVWLRTSIAPLRSRASRAGNLVLVIEDVSTQYAQELAEIVRSALTEIYVFDARSLRFVYANESALENTGYPLRQLTDLTPLDLEPAVDADDFARQLESLRAARERQVSFETVQRRSDGSSYPVRVRLRYGSFRGGPAYVANIDDLSRQRNAEHAQRLSSARLAEQAALLDAVARSLEQYLRDDDLPRAREVLLGAAQRLTGSRWAIMGTLTGQRLCVTNRRLVPNAASGSAPEPPTEDGLHEERCIDVLSLDGLLGEVVASGVLKSKPGHVRSGDLTGVEGETSDLENVCAAPVVVHGSVSGVVVVANRAAAYDRGAERALRMIARVAGVLLDAKRRNDREEEVQQMLQQSQKLEAIGQLTGGIAHDFNNLLLVIRGGVEQLQRQDGLDERAGRVLTSIEAACDRAADLVSNLLAFARRRVQLPVTLNLAETIRDMADMLRRTLGGEVDLQVRVPDTCIAVTVDRSQLESAILNLAINARDAMVPEGGRLRISLRVVDLTPDDARCRELPPGSCALLEVADTGHGVPAEIAERIFDPFFTTKAVGAGTGLGLSMVLGFVKQSGGHIELVPAPGRGAVFRLYFPVTADAVEPQASDSVPAPPGAPGASILVVDDDEVVRGVVQAMLEAAGHRVVAVGVAAEALALLQRGHACDLLLTDVVLPGGMNGFALVEQAAALRPGLKVLVMSGYPDGWHESDLGSGGKFVWLAKPFSRAELDRAVAAALGTMTLDRPERRPPRAE